MTAIFLVGTLNHPQLRLRQPVALTVEREGDIVLVSRGGRAEAAEWDEWGEGPHLAAAVEDWQQTVTELYLTLQGAQDRLGPAMAVLWTQLQMVVEVRP